MAGGGVHLTFDNGPDPVVTPRVLDTLERHGVAATFFVVGKQLATTEGMDLARAIVRRGHRLGNHSYSHGTPLGEDPGPEAVARELVATQALLDQIWSGPRWFRPFGGGGKLGDHLLSPESVEWLVAGGFTCVLWDSVPGDWQDPSGWVERALRDVSRCDPCVVVLHDVLPEAMERLDEFISRASERGHHFTDALPESCLPIVNGEPRPGLEAHVRRPTKG
ncbi:MAG: polysaccharide deacetylase family protein [Myxococcales bacterium]|nr:polysaccharide deacetylase family protein [Myxococcales bacterium]